MNDGNSNAVYQAMEAEIQANKLPLLTPLQANFTVQPISDIEDHPSSKTHFQIAKQIADYATISLQP